jgi:SAM-dependent methyltransferase
LESFLDRQACWTAGLRSRIYSLLPLRRAGRVVEIGCGTGVILRELAALTEAAISGVDIDEGLLAVARRSCPENVELVRADASRSRLPRADIVLFHHFLHHIEALGPFLSRIRRSLEKGGLAVVLAEYDWSCALEEPRGRLLELLRRSLREDGLDLRRRAEIEEAFEAGGFDPVATGSEPGVFSAPDRWFLDAQASALDRSGDPEGARALRAQQDSSLAVPVMWGIWRRA